MIKGITAPAIAFTLCILFFGQSNLQAGGHNASGNPYGNGTFFTDTGTYTAIFRGQNLTGLTEFSVGPDVGSNSVTTTSQQVPETGSGIPGWVSVYFNGITFVGPADSVTDIAANQIASSFVLMQVGTGNGAAFGIQQGQGALTYNSTYSGAWTATLQNAYPNQTFNGNGSLSLGQVMNTTDANNGKLITYQFQVTGMQISSSVSTFQ